MATAAYAQTTHWPVAASATSVVESPFFTLHPLTMATKRKAEAEPTATTTEATNAAAPTTAGGQSMKFWGSFVFVQDFDRAVRFYTETLGLKLLTRYGNDWAEVQGAERSMAAHR